MLLNKDLSPELVRRGLETVDLCARQEAHMVDNVLEMSRLITGTLVLDLVELDFDELIADTVAEVSRLAADRGVTVAGFEPRAGGATADRARVRQVLYNLLENAVKFTPSGGRVSVELEGDPAALRLRVRDTGIGFPAEVALKLFSRFRQGNSSSSRIEGGLGLGLALAKALIELHGGAIDAESGGPGCGACFTVTLPRAPPGRAGGGGRS
jgi:signal transduction histidine kinase